MNSRTGFFINYDSEISKISGLNQNPEIIDLSKLYSDKVNKIKKQIEELAKIEELIYQNLSLQNIRNTAKLSLVNGYIYVRVPFIRRSTAAIDIRCVVLKQELTTKSIDELYNDETFMNNAIEMLSEKIKTILKQNKDIVLKNSK